MSVSWYSVLRAQLRLLLLSRAPWFLMTLCCSSWAFLSVIAWLEPMVINEFRPDMIYGGATYVICSAIGGLWAVLVWRDEPPRARTYHWSLPVDTTRHDALRGLAGLLWLYVGVALYFAVGAAVLAMHGVSLSLERVGALGLVAPFLSATLMYLLVIGLATAMNRPFEYVVIALIAVPALTGLGRILHLDPLLSLMSLFTYANPHGLLRALLQPAVLATGHDVVGGHGTIEHWPMTFMIWMSVSIAAAATGLFWNRGKAS